MNIITLPTASFNGGNAVISGVTIPSGYTVFIGATEVTATAQGTVTDSAGNTYNVIASKGLNSNASLNGIGSTYIATITNALVGGSITFTPHTGGGGSFGCITAIAISNIISNDPTTSVAAAGHSRFPSVVSGSPTVPVDLFVGISCIDNGQSPSVPTGWTGSFTSAAFGGSGVGGATILSQSAQTYNPSYGIAVDWAAFIIGLKIKNNGLMLVF